MSLPLLARSYVGGGDVGSASDSVLLRLIAPAALTFKYWNSGEMYIVSSGVCDGS